MSTRNLRSMTIESTPISTSTSTSARAMRKAKDVRQISEQLDKCSPSPPSLLVIKQSKLSDLGGSADLDGGCLTTSSLMNFFQQRTVRNNRVAFALCNIHVDSSGTVTIETASLTTLIAPSPPTTNYRPSFAMSAVKRVNRRPNASAYTPSPSTTPGPTLYPPSNSGPSGRGSGRSSPPVRPGSAASQASQYSESPFGGGMSSGAAAFGTAHNLEGHNDDLLKGLLGKVDVLKNLTIGIGDEVRAGNLELSGMTDDFGSTSNILSGTWKRMTRMANRQGSNWCWFMAFLLFVLWLFMLVWWFRR